MRVAAYADRDAGLGSMRHHICYVVALGAHHRPKAHAATQSTPTTNAEAAASQAPASVARLVVTYKCGCQHALVLPTESRSERHALPGDHVFAIVR